MLKYILLWEFVTLLLVAYFTYSCGYYSTSLTRGFQPQWEPIWGSPAGQQTFKKLKNAALVLAVAALATCPAPWSLTQFADIFKRTRFAFHSLPTTSVPQSITLSSSWRTMRYFGCHAPGSAVPYNATPQTVHGRQFWVDSSYPQKQDLQMKFSDRSAEIKWFSPKEFSYDNLDSKFSCGSAERPTSQIEQCFAHQIDWMNGCYPEN